MSNKIDLSENLFNIKLSGKFVFFILGMFCIGINTNFVFFSFMQSLDKVKDVDLGLLSIYWLMLANYTSSRRFNNTKGKRIGEFFVKLTIIIFITIYLIYMLSWICIDANIIQRIPKYFAWNAGTVLTIFTGGKMIEPGTTAHNALKNLFHIASD